MLEFIVVVLCLILNAILSGTEMAFVSTGRASLRELARHGSHRAQQLLEMKSRPERILSIIQIGITLVGAIAAAVGGAGAEESLSPYFESRFGVSPDTAESISLALVVIPLTAFSVVFGELFPKAIALRNPSGIALMMTPFLRVSDKVLSPIINVLENSTNLLLRLFRIKHSPGTDPGADASPGYAVSFGIMRRLTVKEIMVPVKEVSVLDSEMSIQEVAKIIAETGHTRTPVKKGNRITGILNSKEFHLFKESHLTDWLSIVRGALYLEENTDIMSALKMLQGQRKHMAIVISNGDPVGIVTIEDILEEFVGDIFDEDDDNVVKQLVRARTNLRRR
ncbi:hemolysin family protein [Bdellovibrio sp. HCB337]|uniref:hemolysin family protein n=1 Tax=Bdellovibrio sp. HCB337 TaxID=3394358 RepID=UPI0039A51B7D